MDHRSQLVLRRLCSVLPRWNLEIARELLIAAAMLGLLAAPTRSQLSSADFVFQGFLPIGDYVLQVDGVDSPDTQIYRSERAPALLVLAPELESAVLVEPRSRKVSSVAIGGLARREDGHIDLLADANLRSQGSFELDGEQVILSVEDHTLVLAVKPPLLGLQSLEGMKGYNPEYSRRAAAYTPSAAALAGLRGQSRTIRVRVYFGSWCPACKQLVPRMMRVAEELAGSKIRFEFYGLPLPLSGDPESERAAIRSVPTGVVFVGGQEAGRISGDHWQSPETALHEIFARF